MNGKYNIWNKWDPLKTVMLGTTYAPEFYRDIKNVKIRSALQQIADESLEDLEGYSNVLKDFGCEVLRPELDPTNSLMDYTDPVTGVLQHNIPRAPLQPRDKQVVLGNKIFYTGYECRPVTQCLEDYNNTDAFLFTHLVSTAEEYSSMKARYGDDQWPIVEQWIEHRHEQSYFPAHVWQRLRAEFDAPGLTLIGRDLYADRMLNCCAIEKINNCKYIKENFNVNYLTIGGHNDGVFGVIKEGAILSLRNIQNYDKTFPGWDICHLPNQSWAKVKAFNQLKNKNYGSFWVPGQEENDDFTEFVTTWLDNQVGYVEETVFDVNVLVLDDKHVCVSQMDNPIVNAFLKKHNMEPVYVPWRHRYFWDGGLHCLTLDLYREGKQQDYFPDRTECVVCEGY